MDNEPNFIANGFHRCNRCFAIIPSSLITCNTCSERLRTSTYDVMHYNISPLNTGIARVNTKESKISNLISNATTSINTLLAAIKADKFRFALSYLYLTTGNDWIGMITPNHFDKCVTIAEVKQECDILLNTN